MAKISPGEPGLNRTKSSFGVTSKKPFDATRILSRASFKEQASSPPLHPPPHVAPEGNDLVSPRMGATSEVAHLLATNIQRGSFYAKQGVDQTLLDLATDRQRGLSSEEAAKRLKEIGKNELQKDPPTPLWRLFLAQFQDLLVILLIIACIISFGLGEYEAATTIIIIVLANAILGVLMESRAGAAIEALEALTSAMCNLMRDSEIKEVKSSDIVPGDIIIFKTGDKIPADVRLIESRNLTVTEASLTGESRPVKKDATTIAAQTASTRKLMPTLTEGEEKAEETVATASPRPGANPLEDAELRAGTQQQPNGDQEKENKEEKKEEGKANGADKGKKEKDKEKEVAPKALTDSNMVYMGCEVLEGSGVGVVIKTGMSTKMGEVAHLLASAEQEDSPLQQKLESLGVRLGIASMVISVAVFAIGMATGHGTDPSSDKPRWLQMLLIAVSLTVAAVPEGLPACVTITLAAGMAHMSKKQAWIRNLHSVETLGSASVICTDKTGTLTAGIQTAVRLWFSGQTFYITGAGYNPEGLFIPSDATSDIARDKDLEQKAVHEGPWLSVLTAGMLACGDKTRLQQSKDQQGAVFWECTGNSSEKPIVVAAAKAAITRDTLSSSYQTLAENPFDSTRKMMSTFVHILDKQKCSPFFGETEYVALVKGAPSVILPKCTSIACPAQDGQQVVTRELTEEEMTTINTVVDDFGGKTFRVLAIAYRPFREPPVDDSATALERDDLVLIGLIASIDPERPGVAESIEKAADAGVRTIMITGDYIKTAKAIAENIKLLPPGSDDDKAIDCIAIRALGEREKALSEEKKKENKEELKKVRKEIDAIITVADVYARAQPIDKLTIVKSLQRQGHVVAMTGDGVNDAPALRQASIGVAMGKSGTEVARSASDMVLMDDNFVSIVLAIEEGRVIYANITKFVFYLLSTNISEVFVILIAVIIGYPSPLKPIQILWLNLITDGLPAIALAVEPAEPHIMEQGPRPKKEGIIEKVMITGVIIQSIVLTTIVLMVYITGIYWATGTWSIQKPANMSKVDYDNGVIKATTMCILTIVFAELLRANTSRSLRLSIFQIGVFTNKYMVFSVIPGILLTLLVTMTPKLRDVFACEPIDGRRWGLVVGLCAIPAAIDELTKLVYRLAHFGERQKVVRRNLIDPEVEEEEEEKKDKNKEKNKSSKEKN